MCVLYVLSCVISDGGPDIVLTTHSGSPALVFLSSVLVHSLLLSLQAFYRRDVLGLHWERVNNIGRNIFFNWLFIVALTARSYRHCHCLSVWEWYFY